MMRILWLSVLLVVMGCGGSSSGDAPPGVAPKGKMNVLFIAIDDLRPELNCYGVEEVQSPVLDQLAAEGTLFERAYCQQAHCFPSRASLLTGRRPDATGIIDFKPNLRDNMPDVVTLPELFKHHGYHTQAFGKIFHSPQKNDEQSWSAPHYESPQPKWGSAEGLRIRELTVNAKPRPTKTLLDISSGTYFERGANGLPFEAPVVPDDSLREGDITTKALETLESVKDQPFFLAVGYYKPHIPFTAPKKYWDLYDGEKIPVARNPYFPKDAPFYANFIFRDTRGYYGMPTEGPLTREQARDLKHGYYACISYVDAQIGRLLDALDRYNLRDNTIVIAWGDHGYQLGEHGLWDKHTNYETSARVPLIISVPGMTGNIRTDGLVEFVDIYPSLAELCGLPLPDKLSGTSFAPLLSKPDLPWKTAAFTQFPRTIKDVGDAMGRAMRTDRYRFVEWRVDDGSSDFVGYELYDHENDPDENVNIANLPESAALVQQLSAQLKAGWQAAKPK
jgi:iduronate 2-sulfatase